METATHKKRGSQRKMHVSWHIAGASLSLIVGIALAPIVRINSFDAEVLLLVGTIALLMALTRLTKTALILSIIAGLSCGLWRGSIDQIARRDYQPYYGQTVQLRGHVVEDVSYDKQGDMRLRISNVKLGDKPLSREVWVSAVTKVDVDRSDIVTVSGKMSEGFGNLPATMKRATLVSRQRPQPGDIALHFRDWFASGIRKAIPDPQASLGSGYLTGQRSSLPASLDSELKIAGLTHIVVVSGYNLTILVGFTRRALAKLSRYLATMTAVAMVCGFILVTGFSPSMTRAGLVTLMSLAAWYYGRNTHPLVILPLAAAITTLINPSYVWGDMGWYLSFGSFAGVLLLGPLLHRYFWNGDDEPGVVRGILVETSAAQIATMPVILFAFGQYSVYALAANMIILPFIPLTMVLTFFAGIGGLTFPAIASWLGLPATAILTYMTTAVHWVANLPAAQGHVTFDASALIISYVAIVLSIVYMWRRTGYSFRSEQITQRMIGDKL